MGLWCYKYSKKKWRVLEICLIFEDKCPKCNQMNINVVSIQSKLDKEITSIFKSISDGLFWKEKKKTITYDQLLEDKKLMIEVIRLGVPYKLYELIAAITPFEERDWANVLDVSIKSLQRYRIENNHRFKSIHSEKILELAEVTHVGMDVFGDLEKFKLWLNTPSYALGNTKPLELLKDSYGKELVLAELTRINYGILV